ncbi:unnamed protein product [Alternaria alternata]
MGFIHTVFEFAQQAVGLGMSVQPIMAPRVFVLAMFDKEAENWLSDDSPIKFERSFTLPGLSKGYDKVYCTRDETICLAIMGTCLVNAALTIAALTTSTILDLSKSYFLLSGIAGVNPRIATIGSVAMAKFAVQVDTQLEIDARQIPSSWRSGYIPMGAETPNGFPQQVHGSEIFELNTNLRDEALAFAQVAKLEDAEIAKKERILFHNSTDGIYHAATLDPTITSGDVTSSNMFFHGRLLCEAMSDTVKIYTSGKGEYTMTAQEDTAILAGLLRAAIQKRVDFSRIILMRSGSNFDRSHEQSEDASLPLVLQDGLTDLATRNLYLAGVTVVNGISNGWNNRFGEGIKADNYVGDYYASLGGTPDFGDQLVGM